MRAAVKQHDRGEWGIGKLTVFVFGTIVAVLFYCAYNILPFYYYYYELRSHFEQMIKVASTESDQEIRKRLWYYINKYEIPAKPEDLKIERDGNKMRIQLSYKEVFYVTWQGKDYDIHVFDFNAYAEGLF